MMQPDGMSFESLVREYHPIIYKICRVYSGPEDFEDLYQEVLISLWRSMDAFEGRSKWSTWLYRVALNTALSYDRKERKRRAKRSDGELPDIPALPQGEAFGRERRIERLYRAISRLKKGDRSIILLYLEEKKYEEIAEVTGLSVSNVGVRINRIKKKLFQLLNNSQ